MRTSWPPRIEIAAPQRREPRRRPALPAGSWPAPGSCGAPTAKGEEPAEAGQIVAAVGARPHGAHRRFSRSPLAPSSAIDALRAPPRPSIPWSTPAEGRGQQAVGTAPCYGGGGAPRRSASVQKSRQCPATTQASAAFDTCVGSTTPSIQSGSELLDPEPNPKPRTWNPKPSRNSAPPTNQRRRGFTHGFSPSASIRAQRRWWVHCKVDYTAHVPGWC